MVKSSKLVRVLAALLQSSDSDSENKKKKEKKEKKAQ
jgi:hypothetical protein